MDDWKSRTYVPKESFTIPKGKDRRNKLPVTSNYPLLRFNFRGGWTTNPTQKYDRRTKMGSSPGIGVKTTKMFWKNHQLRLVVGSPIFNRVLCIPSGCLVVDGCCMLLFFFRKNTDRNHFIAMADEPPFFLQSEVRTSIAQLPNRQWKWEHLGTFLVVFLWARNASFR